MILCLYFVFIPYPNKNGSRHRGLPFFVEKLQRSWKREDGEKNSVKYRVSKKTCGNIQPYVDAFELGKFLI